MHTLKLPFDLQCSMHIMCSHTHINNKNKCTKKIICFICKNNPVAATCSHATCQAGFQTCFKLNPYTQFVSEGIQIEWMYLNFNVNKNWLGNFLFCLLDSLVSKPIFFAQSAAENTSFDVRKEFKYFHVHSMPDQTVTCCFYYCKSGLKKQCIMPDNDGADWLQ